MTPLRSAIPSMLLIGLGSGLSGCVGQVIGTTADAAIAVVKVPFKVGGAVVDVMTDDDDNKKKSDDK